MSEKHFIEGCENLWKEGKGSVEILNWYRNLYYKEEPDTERKTVADALNDILPELTRLREKQMPKKPVAYGKYNFICPVCKQKLSIEREDISIYDMTPPKHCDCCGQALDWSGT